MSHILLALLIASLLTCRLIFKNILPVDMNPIEPWLRRKFKVAAAQNLFLAGLALGLGLLVLVVTYFFTYAVIWFAVNMGGNALSQLLFSHSLHITHREIQLGCVIFLGLLFLGNARTCREYLEDYTLNQTAPPALIGHTGLTGSLSTLLFNSDASAKLITDFLYTGPRLIAGSVRAFRQCAAIRRLDPGGLAEALTILRDRPGRIATAELAAQLPAYDIENILGQLRGVEGVMFLETKPPAITLNEQLRLEMLRLPCSPPN